MSYTPLVTIGGFAAPSNSGIDLNTLNHSFINETGDTMRGYLKTLPGIEPEDVVNKSQLDSVENKCSIVDNKFTSFKLTLSEINNRITNIENSVYTYIDKAKSGLQLVVNKTKSSVEQFETKINNISYLLKLNEDPETLFWKIEKEKKKRMFEQIRQKYYEVEDRKDRVLDIKLRKNIYDGYDKLEHAFLLNNSSIDLDKKITGDFTFIVVLRHLTKVEGINTLVRNKSIENKKLNLFGEGMLYLSEQNYVKKPIDFKKHVFVLSYGKSKGAVYFNEHMENKLFITPVFEWGDVILASLGKTYVYEFIIFDKTLEMGDIRKIINAFAKYHNIPQNFTDLTDRVERLEETIRGFKKLVSK